MLRGERAFVRAEENGHGPGLLVVRDQVEVTVPVEVLHRDAPGTDPGRIVARGEKRPVPFAQEHVHDRAGRIGDRDVHLPVLVEVTGRDAAVLPGHRIGHPQSEFVAPFVEVHGDLILVLVHRDHVQHPVAIHVRELDGVHEPRQVIADGTVVHGQGHGERHFPHQRAHAVRDGKGCLGGSDVAERRAQGENGGGAAGPG